MGYSRDRRYKPYHIQARSYLLHIDGWPHRARRQWRVEGNQLIATYKNQEVKATIVKITGDELKLKFAGKDTVYTWTRVK
jgi:hypothetical protein